MTRTIAASLALSALLLTSGCSILGGTHRSDKDLIRNFELHREELEELVRMTIQDSKLRRVDDDWTDPENPADVGVGPARVAQYRAMMENAGITRGFAAYGEPGYVQFLASANGIVPSGSSKGYLHTTRTPEPLVENLDAYAGHDTRSSNSGAVYRRIEGDWYLFYEAN